MKVDYISFDCERVGFLRFIVVIDRARAFLPRSANNDINLALESFDWCKKRHLILIADT